MAYNIESLIQRGSAQVALNVEGGELTVTLKAIDPTVADAEAVVINRELLRDVQATLSNNNYPTTGYCEIANGANDGELVITAPSNMPLAEGENLIVLSGVYCGAMFVQTYSVTGVAEGSATASAAITLDIIGSTPATPEPQEQLVTEGNVLQGSEASDNAGFMYNPEKGSILFGNAGFSDNAKIETGEDARGALAGGYTDMGEIKATKNGAFAFGIVQNGGNVVASAGGALAVGMASNGDTIEASAIGAQAFGYGTQAADYGQMALGMYNVKEEDHKYALIVGNGTAGNARHNAFAIGWNSSLYLFQSDGTPIELTPAKLAALVA